jgi:ribosomal protein S18 acetylase RimI-like enzyme
MFFCEFADTALVARRGVGRDDALGLGRRLYERFAAVAAQRGAAALKVITSRENQGSIAFHRRMGFTEMTLHPDYQGSGWPRVVMRRPP